MKFLDKIGLAKLWEHITALFSSRVPQTRKINNKPLETDITLNYTDLEGSVPSDSLPTAGANPGAVKTGGVATIENGVITKVSEATKVSKTLTVGAKTYDGSAAVSISAADLGLSAAMKFLGTSITAITDGSTTNPINIGGVLDSVTAGNVVLYGSKEFVWNGSSWEELGNEGSYKVVQSAVSSPAASGNATAFIDTISQNANGQITATKKNVTFPTLSGGASASADATVAGGVTVSGHAVTVAKKTLTPGNNVQITGDATKITISATDTTYENATTTSAGLMSAADKTALDKVVSDMEDIDYPVDSVNGKTGAVVLSASDVGADVAGTASQAVSELRTYTIAELAGKVSKVVGKTLTSNDYTDEEKTKLSGIAAGAEVNQNAFSNVVVGSTTIAADSKTDTLTLVAGDNITLTPDASGDKITITGASHENTTYSAGTGLEMDGTTINHSNSVTAKTTYNQATATPGYGGTFKITEPKYDAQGHITGTQVATITMPSAQTIPTSLKNPNALTIGSKTYDGSSAITLEASDLGLSNALHFIGVKASLPLTGNTNGDVVLVGNKEYVYSDGWVELGDGDSHALKTVQVKAGDGLAGGGAISGDVTLSHGDTSSVTNLTANGRKYVTGLTFDTYGHVTGVTTGTETVENTDTNTTYDLAASVSSSNGNVKLNLTAGGSGSGTDSVTIKGSGATTVTTDANGVVTIDSSQTTISGNAGSATKLATARTIDGVNFDGTAAISHYGECSTAASTAEKTVDLAGFELVVGSKITVKFTVDNMTFSPTLNVNNTGAKAIMYRGAAISITCLRANRVYEFIYDGTNWELIGDIDSPTISASLVTEGTFAGRVNAARNSQSPEASLLRNSKLATVETDPS